MSRRGRRSLARSRRRVVRNRSERRARLEGTRPDVRRRCGEGSRAVPDAGVPAVTPYRELDLLAEIACIWEVNARKVGNVYPGVGFADVSAVDFLLSAAAIRGLLRPAGFA